MKKYIFDEMCEKFLSFFEKYESYFYGRVKCYFVFLCWRDDVFFVGVLIMDF